MAVSILSACVGDLKQSSNTTPAGTFIMPPDGDYYTLNDNFKDGTLSIKDGKIVKLSFTDSQGNPNYAQFIASSNDIANCIDTSIPSQMQFVRFDAINCSANGDSLTFTIKQIDKQIKFLRKENS